MLAAVYPSDTFISFLIPCGLATGFASSPPTGSTPCGAERSLLSWLSSHILAFLEIGFVSCYSVFFFNFLVGFWNWVATIKQILMALIFYRGLSHLLPQPGTSEFRTDS
jgi:hypothetical protein